MKYTIETDNGPVQVDSYNGIQPAVNAIVEAIYQQNVNAGWWDKPREDGTLLMLATSELSEAMEGFRKDLMDDHLLHRKMAEVELADAVIRIFDLAGAKNMDLGGAIAEKLAYNAIRKDHTREHRATENGKKF